MLLCDCSLASCNSNQPPHRFKTPIISSTWHAKLLQPDFQDYLLKSSYFFLYFPYFSSLSQVLLSFYLCLSFTFVWLLVPFYLSFLVIRILKAKRISFHFCLKSQPRSALQANVLNSINDKFPKFRNSNSIFPPKTSFPQK